MRSTYLVSSCLAGCLAFNFAPASAQQTTSDAIDALEHRLEARERQHALEIAELRREIAELKGQVAGDDAKPEPAYPESKPIAGGTWPSLNDGKGKKADCALTDEESIGQVVESEPWRLINCDRAQFADYDEDAKFTFGERLALGAAALRDLAAGTYIPGRPLQTGGIKPTIELGKSSEASLSISIPIAGRSVGDTFYRPTVFTPQVVLSTPLSGGSGVLFTGTQDDDEKTDPNDFADGISVKAGFDWLSFDKVPFTKARKSLDKFLSETAIKACMKEVGAGETKAEMCDRARIVDWVFELKKDTGTASGYSHKREAMAGQLANIMWRPEEKAIPSYGWGGSVKYFAKDFKYSQAAVTDELADSKIKVVPDFSVDLLPSVTQQTDNFEVELHGLLYADLRGDAEMKRTPIGSVPGIMFVPQVTHKSTYAFAKGTEFTDCTAQPDSTLTKCDTLRIDRPRHLRSTLLSLEARTQMINLPVLDKIGFAPKFSYSLDDDGKIIDVPFYFATKGEFASGIRVTHSTGFEDVLGNDVDPQWVVSIFFSPLTFNAF